MENKFPFSDTNKRYYTQDYYLRHRFGSKLGRVSLSGGFTCPNRDGSKGTDGCAFCSEKGSGDFLYSGDLASQFTKASAAAEKKWGVKRFIAYFQSFSGTYASPEVLRSLYQQALEFPGVEALSIATRPDCIQKETVELLKEIGQHTFLCVELGLQSIWDKTRQAMGCAYTLYDFERAYDLLRQAGIRVCVHIIDYLPGEDFNHMISTARALAHWHVPAVKIHSLYILCGTRLQKWWEQGFVKLPEEMEYVHTVCRQLEVLAPETVVERLTGDGDQRELLAPLWSKNKRHVLAQIDKELVRMGTWQGRLVFNKVDSVTDF